MGVSGCGKSTVGAQLAAALEAPDPDENAQIYDVASRPEVIVAAVAAGFSFAK